MTETAPWRSTGSTPDADAQTEIISDEGVGGATTHQTTPLTWDMPGFGPPSSPPPPPAGPTPQAPAERRRRPALYATALALTAALAGASGVAVGAAIEHQDSSSVASSGLPAVSSGSSGSIDPNSYAAVAAKVLPSVVSIDVSGAGGSGTGSGVIIRNNGYILTNNHVVADAANGGSIQVTFNDGSTAAATVVGTDAPSDLAVIKVDKTNLTAATLGKSSEVHVGDPVLAVGSPLGLSGTVTAGIVSALNRPVNTTDAGSLPGSSLPTVIDAIQTDAAINPGNSGGALVNAEGQVIGINSAIASLGSTGGQSGNIGVGFAIPIDQARSIASQLIASGTAKHPMLGVSLAAATTGNGNSQALVQQVQAGSPADKAGLKAGDVIVAVDSERTDSPDALIAAIRTHSPGDTVKLTVLRDGKQLTMTATLAEAATSQG